MPIPDFQTIMSPLLAYTSDNNEHSLRDTAENLAVYFKLTPEDRQEPLQ
jgi:restriction system protein